MFFAWYFPVCYLGTGRSPGLSTPWVTSSYRTAVGIFIANSIRAYTTVTDRVHESQQDTEDKVDSYQEIDEAICELEVAWDQFLESAKDEN